MPGLIGISSYEEKGIFSLQDVKDAPILSYIDDVEEILADAGELSKHEEDLVHDEVMEDHEPIYQPSEEEEDNEKQAGLKEQSVQTNVEEIYHDVTSTLNGRR